MKIGQYEIDNRVLVAGIVACAMCLVIFWPSSKNEPAVDVATGVPPISRNFEQVAIDVATNLRDLSPEERAVYVHQHYPQLGPAIVAHMRDRSRIAPNQRVERVDYLFGSMDGVIAEQGNGPEVKGDFNDQLLAVVKIAGVEEPAVLIVICSNGLVVFPEEQLRNLQAVGNQASEQLVFTIARGEGLTNYVSYQTAMDFAELHNLKVMKVIGNKREAIDVETARGLENETDNIRVVVSVKTGDRFSVADMSYTPA